ncbi:MAG TPA: SPOR domain-containing protein [Saprospiraceae bacterium]|nr:SPOR domain-containing protein [Saprospiraceae bacterium]HMP25253.1 SPOR domain-containing protein [Saprospiraceae bacterium]
MLRAIVLLLCIMGCAMALPAQNIQLREEPQISQMMERFAAINKATATVNGWRVQVLATPDRQQLERTRQIFQYKYPNIPTDWKHANPWYKLYAGAFSTKLEAIRLQYLLRRDYPSAYLVRDNTVRPAELIGIY